MSEVVDSYSITHPSHYHSDTHELQPFDVMRAWEEDGMTYMESFFRFNALKYLWRYPNKNGIEDLIKCRDYIDLLIEEISE